MIQDDNTVLFLTGEAAFSCQFLLVKLHWHICPESQQPVKPRCISYSCSEVVAVSWLWPYSSRLLVTKSRLRELSLSRIYFFLWPGKKSTGTGRNGSQGFCTAVECVTFAPTLLARTVRVRACNFTGGPGYHVAMVGYITFYWKKEQIFWNNDKIDYSCSVLFSHLLLYH